MWERISPRLAAQHARHALTILLWDDQEVTKVMQRNVYV